MTDQKPPQDAGLMPCRDAFEKWYFPYREKCWQQNILLDDNDATSMWLGWEAAFNTRPNPAHAARQEVGEDDIERLANTCAQHLQAIATDPGWSKSGTCAREVIADYLRMVATPKPEAPTVKENLTVRRAKPEATSAEVREAIEWAKEQEDKAHKAAFQNMEGPSRQHLLRVRDIYTVLIRAASQNCGEESD